MSSLFSDLSSKTAIITGAAGLLGLEHSRALLSVGTDLILLDINQTSLDSARVLLLSEFPAANIHCFPLDITDESSISVLSQYLLSVDINPSILINNASINPTVSNAGLSQNISSRLENFSLEEWNSHIDVGLTGAFLCIKHFGPLLLSSPSSSIINISSDLSVIAPDHRLYRQDGLRPSEQPVKPVAYSVIKTALIGLTRYVAGYWATDGLRCNAVSPGGVYVDQPPRFVSELSSLIPMGRMASKHEYHGIIQFLSSEASTYLTGQNIVVDGGRSLI